MLSGSKMAIKFTQFKTLVQLQTSQIAAENITNIVLTEIETKIVKTS